MGGGARRGGRFGVAMDQGVGIAGSYILSGTQPNPQDDGVWYVCGECGAENNLRQGDAIICRECGYRILYKKRTRKVVQYEAR